MKTRRADCVDFKDEVEAIRLRMLAYGTDPEFCASCLGLTARSMNSRAQQIRAFGALMGPVTNTLAGWRILDVGCGAAYWLRGFERLRSLEGVGRFVNGLDRLGYMVTHNADLIGPKP